MFSGWRNKKNNLTFVIFWAFFFLNYFDRIGWNVLKTELHLPLKETSFIYLFFSSFLFPLSKSGGSLFVGANCTGADAPGGGLAHSASREWIFHLATPFASALLFSLAWVGQVGTGLPGAKTGAAFGSRFIKQKKKKISLSTGVQVQAVKRKSCVSVAVEAECDSREAAETLQKIITAAAAASYGDRFCEGLSNLLFALANDAQAPVTCLYLRPRRDCNLPPCLLPIGGP